MTLVPSECLHLHDCNTSVRIAAVSAMYDHRYWKTRDPVRSPIDKPVTARPVLGWVTTGESLVLYILTLFGISRVVLNVVHPVSVVCPMDVQVK
jgi:hypothetical protein